MWISTQSLIRHWWYKTWQKQWIQSYSCKTKTSQETEKNSQKFLEPTRKPKVHLQRQFHGIWQILWTPFPGIIVRRHRTGRKLMGLLREQCASEKKGHLHYCCNQVWTTNGGHFHGMLLQSAKHSRSLVWWEDILWEGGSEYHLKGPVLACGAMVEYHPISAKDPSRLHQFGPKSLARVYSLDTH